MSSRTQIIGIDCRLAGKKHAGIGRYVENLITRVPVLAPQYTWVYFFHDQEQADMIGQFPANVKIVLAPVRHYSLSEQLKMPSIFAREKLDLLHVPHFNIPWRYSGKLVVTIHDLLWHQYKGAHVTTLPAWQYWFKHLLYLQTVKRAVRKAENILVPAQTIQAVVCEYYPEVAQKIIVTKEGIDAHFLSSLQTTTASTSHSQSRQKFFLYVGSLYPHKNVKVVLDALPQLPEYALHIVGARNVFQDEVRQYVQEKRLESQVKFLGYVPDVDLMEMYNQATALVQPSLSEGFGLTGVEAMAAGAPVLASNIPIFREIYQDAAMYFDPGDPHSFIEAVRSLEKQELSAVLEKGKQVADQYSWDKMAQETLAVYKGNFEQV